MGVQGVQFYGGWEVSGNGTPIMHPQGQANVPLAQVADVGEGRAIVFGDEWISFDSEWQSIPQVEVFWANMIQWVGPSDICFEPQ